MCADHTTDYVDISVTFLLCITDGFLVVPSVFSFSITCGITSASKKKFHHCSILFHLVSAQLLREIILMLLNFKLAEFVINFIFTKVRVIWQISTDDV